MGDGITRQGACRSGAGPMTRHPMARGLSRRQSLALMMAGSGLAALAAGGCAAPDPRPYFPDLGFSHLPPLVFRARRLDVDEAWAAPLRRPNVDHDMPVPPARAARTWAHDRLKTTGDGDTLLAMTIHDAGVTEKRLSVRGGLEGAFHTDQAERYDAVLDATLDIQDSATGVTLAQASARVWRHVTLGEDASINDRETAWFTLVEGLMADFNTRMEDGIRTYLSDYLVA